MLCTNYSIINHIYLIYMYKHDFALNNLQDCYGGILHDVTA